MQDSMNTMGFRTDADSFTIDHSLGLDLEANELLFQLKRDGDSALVAMQSLPTSRMAEYNFCCHGLLLWMSVRKLIALT
jgi:hypothetical protein